MTLDVYVNYGYREEDVKAALDVEALASFVIERESCPDSTEVSISFVDDDEIWQLNRDFRGVDRPTDVLSFECDGVDDELGYDAVVDETFELGDIVVAPDVAQRQAPEYGISFGDELSLLVVHGLLHLCGYDHMEDDEAVVMESRERELLSEYYGRAFERCAGDANDHE